MMTVYIDEIFAVNLLMDALVLWATGKLTQRNLIYWRILIAAMIGAIYSVVLFLPGCICLSNGLAKAICACLMVWFCFDWMGWQAYVKTMIYLYLVSFALCGGTVALMYFCGERIVQTWSGLALVEVDFNVFWLIGGALLLLLLVHILRNTFVRKLEQTLQVVSISITLRAQRIRLRLLVDSGNLLTDPTTGKPVVVVQNKFVKSLFTEEEYEQLVKGRTDAILHLPTLSGRMRLIPYQTVGYQGVLLGVRTDSMYVEDWELQMCDVILALSSQQFAADGTYQGIISSRFI